MKAHNLAKVLRKLADVLESGPNVPLSDFSSFHKQVGGIDSEVVAVNLRTLLALSRINKKEWVNLINEYGYEIKLNPRDSARDVLGKLLRYLDSHPEAIDLLKKWSQEKGKEPSALSKALDVLLEDV
jgi:hypothetical protein